MKKLIFIISFLLAIQYGNTLLANTNETIEEQESALGISEFIEEAEKYTKDTFNEIDIASVYTEAISGKINTSNLLNTILKITGTEVLSTIRILGYILIIIILHGIIKSISEGLGNRRSF